MKQLTVFTDKKESENRMDICKKCDHYNKYFNQCTICGCFMKIKTKLKNSKCPINLW